MIKSSDCPCIAMYGNEDTIIKLLSIGHSPHEGTHGSGYVIKSNSRSHGSFTATWNVNVFRKMAHSPRVEQWMKEYPDLPPIPVCCKEKNCNTCQHKQKPSVMYP